VFRHLQVWEIKTQ